MPFLSVPALLCPALEKLNSLEIGLMKRSKVYFLLPSGFSLRCLQLSALPGCGQGQACTHLVQCNYLHSPESPVGRRSLQQPRLPPGLLSMPPCSQGSSHAGPSQMSWLLSWDTFSWARCCWDPVNSRTWPGFPSVSSLRSEEQLELSVVSYPHQQEERKPGGPMRLPPDPQHSVHVKLCFAWPSSRVTWR